jgi:hypothetical protein
VRIAIVIAVVAVVTAIALSQVPDREDGPRGLIARLSLQDDRTSFRVGEPIHMRLEITNYGRK